MTKNCFPDAKTQLKNVQNCFMRRMYIYVQKYINGKDEKIDPTEGYWTNFFLSSYFIEKPVYNVEGIEERLNEINLGEGTKKKEEIVISWTRQR